MKKTSKTKTTKEPKMSKTTPKAKKATKPKESKPKAKALNEADKIWNEIKDVELDLFALPNQTIKDHATVIPISQTELHLDLKSTAAFAAMEIALKKKFEVAKVDKYIVVTRL